MVAFNPCCDAETVETYAKATTSTDRGAFATLSEEDVAALDELVVALRD
jgi:hypothetical protein